MAHVTVRLAAPKDAAIMVEFNIAMARGRRIRSMKYQKIKNGKGQLS